MAAEHEAWLSKNLKEVFALPDDAREWLLGLFNAIQVFDDMADGDHPDRDSLDTAIADTLVNMPGNPFFQQHWQALLPLLAVQILKWQASDRKERAGEADEVSFVWRAGFYDIVLAVVQLVHGEAVALDVCDKVASLYGEKFPAYVQEMKDA